MTQIKSMPATSRPTTNSGALFIIGVLFFSMGFITWLNGTLIPFLKLACQLDNDIQAFFVTFFFYMAYLFLRQTAGASDFFSPGYLFRVWDWPCYRQP